MGWFLLVVLLLLSCLLHNSLANRFSRRKNSKFVWKRPQYAMPWLKGNNVCAVEEVQGSRKRYYSECMAYLPRKICGKPTFIRYHCCTGYERTDPSATDCDGVVPIENLMVTAKHLYLKDFRKFVRQAGQEPLLSGHEGDVLTVFGPQNKAFLGLDDETRYLLSTKNQDENLLGLHMTRGRYFLKDLYNDQQIPSLMPDPADPSQSSKIRINRYSNGIVTANCARIVLPNQVSTNGIMHVTEKVIEPAEDRGSTMELLLQDGRFEELVTALIVSGLANELRENGHFTIIAPTDDAFRSAPEKVLQRILSDKEMLKRLLQYHILDETYCAAAIIGPVSLRTMEGQKVNLSCGLSDQMTINGVPVIEADMLATNGVVHAVDEILIPDAAKSLGERLIDLGLLQFMEYAQSAGLSDVLDGSVEGNFTFFAPNADAFSKLTKEQKRILQTQSSAVKKVFNYHVVPGKYTTKEFRGEDNIRSVSEELSASIHINVYQKGYGINNANIVSSDHEASNGVIHIIDKIIFPPEVSVREKVTEDSQLSMFLSLIEDTNLEHHLITSSSNITLFAPTNDAFDQIESSMVERLMADTPTREKFLRYHILRKPIYTSGIRAGLRYRFRTEAREWIHMQQVEKHDPVIVNEEALILSPDIETTNGVMHVIDTVLKCPCVDGLDDGS